MFGKMGRALVFLLLCSLQTFAQSDTGFRGGLPHFFNRMKMNDTLRVVYLGGSITQAPGYRIKSANWLRSRYPEKILETFNAGVGGTGSDLGAFRLSDDVLSHHPDLVFIEFAVNDQSTDTSKVLSAMDGIIQQILAADPTTSICLLYTVSEQMLADYKLGQLPASVRTMERVAKHYQLPSINFAPEVLALQKTGKLVFRRTGEDHLGKIIFTADGTHPLDAGHELYAQQLEKAWVGLEQMKPDFKRSKKPMTTAFRKTARYEPQRFVSAGWKKVTATDPQGRFLGDLPGLVFSENQQDSLVIDFNGTMLGLEDVIGPASNGLSIRVDGAAAFKVIRFDKYCNSYRRYYVLLDPLPAGKHHVVIKPDFTSIDKVTILKPENRSGPAHGKYGENRTYIGKILIGGKLIQK
jgi:lysophospholipase L1-like esterase